MAEKKFNLADAVRQSVGEASIAAMDAQAPVSGERTIENITSEILHYQAVGGDAVVQIGKRLIEAKEMLPHGGWLPWLSEQVNYSERTAQRLMKIARDCSNPTLVSDLGRTKALALLALPDEEQKALMEAYDVPNMSKRELEDAIRERDEARRQVEAANEAAQNAERMAKEVADRLERAEDDLEQVERQRDDAEKRIKELENRPVDVAVQVDEDACRKAADEARKAAEAEWSAKVKAAEDKLAKAKDAVKKAEEKAAQAAKGEAAAAKANTSAANEALQAAKAEADRLRVELAEAQKAAKAAAVAGDAEVSEFKLYFGLAQENINKMRGLLLKVRSREDKTTGEKLAAAMTALADAVKEAAK